MKQIEFVNIFKISPIATKFYDPTGILLYANPACLDLFGIESIENIKSFNLFTDPNLSQQLIADIRAGESVVHEIEIDFDLVKLNNQYQTIREGRCFFECFINPTINENLVITGYLVHIIEISERKRTEWLLEQQSVELQKLVVTKDRFFKIIAHDLKSPFNAIIGFANLMIENFHDLDEDTFIKGLKTIESASVHAYTLVENLLIWAKNQTGSREFAPEVLNVKQLISDLLAMTESNAMSKGIRINSSINNDYKIFADKNMIDSVMRNLISNAIKFSHRGGTVSIKATDQNGEMQLSVSDRGVGISEGKLSAIFEIDTFTNTAGTENELGTGLGLIISKDFILKHRGKIWVESTPGKGSTFNFTLPLI